MPAPLNVLIAGGGVAALEAALALRELAGPLVDVTLIAPQPEFVYRPTVVREPFAGPAAERYEVARMAADMDATLLVDSLSWVDAEAQVAHLAEGAPMAYDALVIASGGHRCEAFAHATTIDDRILDEQLHGLVQDIEGGYVHSVAFVIPARMAWPLPIYELALMTAKRARDMDVEVAVTIVTPEPAPLSVFGDEASAKVSEVLAEAGISVEASADASVPAHGQVSIFPGTRSVLADRVIALPTLTGPAVRGLPVGAHGFLTVDAYCRVRGVDAVYAAGDAADFPIKHGGLASLQADTIALGIAAAAGAPVEARPYTPVIRGLLVTGGKPLYLSARLTAGRGFNSEITETPTWKPAAKIAAKYLAPFLDRYAAEREHAHG